MKANRQSIPLAALGAGTALSLLLGACVALVQAPVAAVPPPARSVPTPNPRPAAPTDWHDAPATPGVWQWSRAAGLSAARFGSPPQFALFTLTCDPRAGSITLAREGDAASAMSIQTTTLSRTLTVRPAGAGILATTLPARDPLLDAIAFSRGRFAVKLPGAEPLYLPAWPEVSRVIEDCR